MPRVVVYEGSQEWSAVYVDGVLDRVGDHYLADERIRELFEVETIQSDDFMLGREGGREIVAKTLDDLNAYSIDRANRLEQAEGLRRKAAELEAQADQLAQP